MGPSKPKKSTYSNWAKQRLKAPVKGPGPNKGYQK
jgi:hypothetical protein